MRIALAAKAPIAFSFLMFPTSVEIARKTGRAPELPSELAYAYLNAIAALADVASRHGQDSSDKDMLVCAAAALAVVEGDIGLAQRLIDAEDD